MKKLVNASSNSRRESGAFAQARILADKKLERARELLAKSSEKRGAVSPIGKLRDKGRA